MDLRNETCGGLGSKVPCGRRFPESGTGAYYVCADVALWALSR